jgi:PAS domain S-box-containing protein
MMSEPLEARQVDGDAAPVRAELFRLLDSMPCAVAVVTPDDRTAFVNGEFTRMLGYRREDMPDIAAMIARFAVSPEQAAELRSSWQKDRPRAGIRRIGMPLRSLTGEQKTVQWDGAFLSDGTVVLTGVDITPREALLEELRANQADLDRAQQIARLGSWTWEPTSNHVIWSAEMYRLFGFESGNGPPDKAAFFSAALHPADRSRYEEARAAHADSNEPTGIELRVARADGAYRWFKFTTERSLDAEGRCISMFGTMQDITEQVESAERAQAGEAKYRQLLDLITDGVVANDRESRITFVNPRMADLLGYSVEEMIGRSLFDFIDPRLMPQVAPLKARVERGERVEYTIELRRKDGRPIIVSVRAVPILDKNGEPTGVIRTALDITAQLEAQQRLAASEEQYRTLVNNVNVGIYRNTADLPGRFLQANPALAHMLGFDSVDELLKTSVGELYVEPDGRRAFIEHVQSAGFVKDAAITLRHRKSGRLIYASVTARAKCDDQGRVLWTDGMIEDITERTLALQQLQEREAELARAQKLAHIGSWTWDLRTNAVRWSAEVYSRFGLTPETHPALDFEAFKSRIHPDDRARVENILQDCIARRIPRCEYTIRVCPAEGVLRHIRVIAELAFDADGTPVSVFGTDQEITEQVVAAENLIASEARYRALYEHIPVMYFTLDAAGVVRSVNRYGAEYLGYAREELVGRSVLEVFHPDDREAVKTQLGHALKQPGKVATWEFRKIRRDGRILWVEEVVRVTTAPDGSPVVLVACEDITSRRQVEAERQRFTERLMEVQEEERRKVSATLHDELGQVLTLARMELESIASRDKKVKAGLANIDRRLDGALQSVRRIAVSLRPPILDDLGLAVALQSLTEDLCAGTRLQCSFRQTGSEPRLSQAAETCLYRVLQESLTNAVRHARASSVEVELSSGAGTVQLRIKDDGRGFDPAARASSGLGLTGMRMNLHRLGGELLIESAAGAGATITATLPADAATPDGRSGG